MKRTIFRKPMVDFAIFENHSTKVMEKTSIEIPNEELLIRKNNA